MKYSSFPILALVQLSACLSETLLPSPEGWLTHYLEPYNSYHARYLALSCKTKHETEFFDWCCHPFLATEKLSSRPGECDPAKSDAGGTEPDDDDLPYCDEDDSDTYPVSSSLDLESAIVEDHLPATTPTAKLVAPTSKSASRFPHVNVATDNVYTGGFATWFYQNGVAGACGAVHSDDDYIAAIDGNRYGNLGERSALCGRWVQIKNSRNGRSVSVYIADACPTCTNSNSIDLSVRAFQAIASLDDGIVPIDWSFV